MSNVQTYFSLTDQDKIDALETAASKLGRPADLLEKDIWVVWSLNALFDSTLGESLVFKGGTSLSKVYKAIDRFSEDVDVTYDIRKIIPDLIVDPDKPYPPNRSQAKKWTEAVQDRLAGWIRDEVVPLLEGNLKPSPRRDSVEKSGTGMSTPISRAMLRISPWVWRSGSL